MKQRTSQILYAYWNDVRRDRLAPLRYEIEPSRIAHVLSETFILEREGTSDYTFRLAGTRICDHLGTELRGRSFLELIGSGDRQTLLRQMATISEQGAVGVFEVAARSGDGRAVRFEILVLPLVHSHQVVSRYLGSFSAIDPPAWLGAEPLHIEGVAQDTLLWPDGRPHAVLERTQHQAPFLPESAVGRIVRFDRRQFRIFDGGRKGE